MDSQEEATQPAKTSFLATIAPVMRYGLQTIIVCAIGIGSFLTVRAIMDTPETEGGRAAREQSFAILTIPAQVQDHRPLISRFGEIVAARTVDMRVLVGGEVMVVNPDLSAGSTINKGDPLVSIDRFEYEGALVQAEANLAEAEARLVEIEAKIRLENDALDRAREQYVLAESDLTRARDLVTRGTITPRAVEEREIVLIQRAEAIGQRENNIAIEKARVEQQKAVVARAEWGLEKARRDLENATLRAPFDAVVISESVEPGRLVNVNDSIASLYDRSGLEVSFTITDAQYGQLLADSEEIVGRSVAVDWILGQQTATYEAVVSRVGAEIAADRGGVEIFAQIKDDHDSPALRPGAFVQAKIEGRLYKNAVEVPEQAIYEGDHVFIVNNGRLERRDITLIGFEGNSAFVVGEFAPDERILAIRLSKAGTGLKVFEEGEQPQRGGQAPRRGGQQREGEPQARQTDSKANPDKSGVNSAPRQNAQLRQ